MKEIKKTVNFSKGGSGYYTPKINIPMSWINDMGITIEDNNVILKYDVTTKKISIEKAEK